MTRDRKIRNLAKRLVELSKEDGLVTEARVSEVLAGLRESAPRRHRSVLKTYYSLVRREIARQTAVVEAPGALAPETVATIESGLSARYGRPIKARLETNTDLIAGVRIRVGDDLFDGSVTGQLTRLAEFVR